MGFFLQSRFSEILNFPAKMGKLRILSAAGILVILSVTQVHCFPRKKLVASLTDGRQSSNSRLASVLSDYWTERGFHDTLTDHLLASESQGKDLMMTGDGDELPSFRGSSKVRLPRGRLAPPPRMSSKQTSLRKKLAANRARQQKRKRMLQKQMMLQRYPRVRLMNSFIHAPLPLREAQRKNDMEIMESVTLIDGGTPQDDGTITIRESPQQSERKYQQGVMDDANDQISPLNYHLQNDDMERAYHEHQLQQHQQHEQHQQHQQHQQQQYLPLQPQPRQPILSASFHALPFHNGYPGDVQGKLSLGQMKQPKSIHSPGMSLNQFQQQLYEQQMQGQPPQHQQPMYPTQKPQVMPIFVIPPFSSPNQNQQQMTFQPTNPPPPPPPPPSPTPTPQHIQTSPPPPPPPPPSSYQSPQPQPTQFNPQKFQEEFQHPFSTPPPSPIKSLAQLTANLLTTASNVMLSTSAAASALAKGELPIPALPKSPSLPQSPKNIMDSLPPLPGYLESSGYPSGLLSQGMLSAASIPSASQVLIPTNPSPYAPPTTARPGVVVDSDEPLFPNQLQSQEESLATKITQLVETGRKILYFPKGVMDTVDVVIKQMERSPMVAYWGDKFFAKVFGDTSGT